ncbi:unnamed protein product [Rhizophagus irregularis]|nr:unnamed protein product [Rhizophagus irregularis]
MKEESGYNFYEEKLLDKTTGETEILDISINITAFMDDTTLISRNKKKITKMIETSKCPGEIQIESKCHHNWILAALKALNEEDIRICNHEISNFNENHRIKGGRTEILDILDPALAKSSVSSRRNKNVMFIEELLEDNGINMLKWKHLCKEKGVNTKGKIPKWFLNIEKIILEDENKETRKIKNEFIGQMAKRNIHLNLLDTNEKINRNNIITWNDNEEFPIFCEDKKKSKSKNYKRIGIHLVMVEDKIDWNNSPFLTKCEGCYRNIGKKKKEKKECLIYLEDDISRMIERRKEDNFIKPYETLNNIIGKNNILKKMIETENRNENYNEKLEYAICRGSVAKFKPNRTEPNQTDGAGPVRLQDFETTAQSDLKIFKLQFGLT